MNPNSNGQPHNNQSFGFPTIDTPAFSSFNGQAESSSTQTPHWTELSGSDGQQTPPASPNLDRRGPLDPSRLAERVLENEGTDLSGRLTIRYYRGDLYRWDGRAYSAQANDELRPWLRTLLENEMSELAEQGEVDRRANQHTVTQAMVTNTLESLMGKTSVDSSNELPIYLGDDPDFPDPRNILATPGGLLDLSVAINGNHTLIATNPDFFTLNGIDYEYEPTATCPEWFRFLRQLWGEDNESIEALQEWFGYLLTADTSQQKMLFMLGPPRSGKGTILRVLTEMVGPGNVASPTLSSLSSNFGLQPLLGKTVATVTDARSPSGNNRPILVERLLSISGGDFISVPRKYREAVETGLICRFVIVSNELPRLADASTALPNRMVVLKLKKSFLGQEDPGLSNRLLAELSGILNWSIKGLARLRRRGHFLQPESGQTDHTQMKQQASPLTAFVSDECELGDYSTSIDDLYARYEEWVESQNSKYDYDKTWFSRKLRDAFPQIEDGGRPRINGVQTSVLQGIRLREKSATADELPPLDLSR